MYSAFQKNSFQNNAFQIANAIVGISQSKTTMGGGYYRWDIYYNNKLANKIKTIIDVKNHKLSNLLRQKDLFSNVIQTRENKYKLLNINNKIDKINKEINILTKQLENL